MSYQEIHQLPGCIQLDVSSSLAAAVLCGVDAFFGQWVGPAGKSTKSLLKISCMFFLTVYPELKNVKAHSNSWCSCCSLYRFTLRIKTYFWHLLTMNLFIKDLPRFRTNEVWTGTWWSFRRRFLACWGGQHQPSSIGAMICIPSGPGGPVVAGMASWRFIR